MRNNQVRSDPLATMEISKLLWRNAIPLIFSLLANSLYNFVDSVFVSHVSEASLTALTMAAPVMSLVNALGCGIAVGLNAAISRALGEQNEHKVRDTAAAAMLMAVIAWIFVVAACIVGVEPYFAWQSGGDAAIKSAGVSYLRICMLFSLGTFGQWVYDHFLLAAGKSSLIMVTLSVASLVNLVLDPILIFGWLGLPAMGTTGAAVATVTGQFSGAITGFVLNEKVNPQVRARFTRRISMESIRSILKVGIPTAIMQSIVAFSGILMNTVLRGFSATAVAVMGVCCRVQSLATQPTQGVDSALIPIIAYNYGAKNRARIGQSIRWAYVYSFSMMGVVLLGMELLPRQLMQLFDSSDQMMAMGIPAIRIMAVMFFLSVQGMVGATVFQALGRGNYSLYLTLTRQVVLPLGLVYLFSLTGKLTLVWTAFVLAEILSTPLTVIFLRNVWRDLMNNQEQKS